MNWNEIPVGINGGIQAQCFTNENTGFINIDHRMLRTTNSGLNWSVVFELPYGSLYTSETKFINDNTGFAAGSYYPQNGFDTLGNHVRYILKTTNAGNNWTYILNDTNGFLFSLIALNESNIYATGIGSTVYSGFIIKTTNGGSTWINELLTPTNSFYNITNSNVKGFTVGYNGAIYKKDNIVSVTQISSVVPESINLYQNYPNPFNPSTSIKFEINKAGFTQLNVFDMTGKEMKNLVEGFKEAGTYEIKFDGMSLNSGVYFYKLMTNGTTITKSMVLIK